MNDKELLKKFFDVLRLYIKNIVLERRFELFRGDEFEGGNLHELMMTAWFEIEKDYDSIFKAIDEAEMETLRRLGLTDAQLQMKVDFTFQHIFGIDGQYRYEASDGGRRIVKKALGYGKILVGTVAAMTGAAEPVKEFIEVAHNAIDSNI